jgi:probable O-glycosylation ligase (exosortase A-associated)
MRDLIVLGIVFGAVPFALARPYIGLCVWSWLGYMNPHRMTWGIAYNFPVVQVVALATLVGMVFTRARRMPPLTPALIVWMMFIIWMCVTTPFALNPEGAVPHFERTIKIQLMVFVTLCLITDREKLNALVWVIVGSIGFFGVKGGLFTVLTGGSYRVWGPPDSFIEGNNEIALALVVVIPLMRYLQLQLQKRWHRLAMGACMGLSGLAVLGSYSRGAFLAAGAMVAFLWWKGRHKLALLLPLVVGSLLALTFMPDAWRDRMFTIEHYDQDASALGRINAWHAAVNLVNDRPLIGGGFDTFTKEMFAKYAPVPTDVHDAHSIYFEVLGEQGYPGIILYLLLGWLVLRAAKRAVRVGRATPGAEWAGDLASMLQVSIIGFAVGGSFLGLAYFDLPYQLMALVLVLDRLTAEAARNPQPVATTAAPTPGIVQPAPAPAPAASKLSNLTAAFRQRSARR